MKIIKKEWSPAQGLDVVEYIADSTSELPSEGIAYGSSCICPDGIYFYYESGWAKFGADAE